MQSLSSFFFCSRLGSSPPMPSKHPLVCRPLLLLPLTFPSIRVFQMSQLFASGGQSIGVSASVLILLGSKITADGDYSHEIKRRLLLGRKVMTNLDSTWTAESPGFSRVLASALDLRWGDPLWWPQARDGGSLAGCRLWVAQSRTRLK